MMTSGNNDYIVKQKHMYLGDDQVLCYYFDDSTDSEVGQPLFDWAESMIQSRENDDCNINSLTIEIDIPAATLELLSEHFGHETGGRFHIDVEYKDTLESYRKQLSDALAMFDKVDYV